MDRIPPEISCDIFLRTLPYPIDPGNPPYKESIRSPLRVSHVCQSWRKLSLSYGELWAYLCMTYSVSEFNTQKRREMVVEIFDTWLSRTNGALLNYVFEFSSPGMVRVPQGVEHIFTMLLQNQHRWKDLALSCQNAVFRPLFPGFSLTNTPLLTSLRLHLHEDSLYPTADFTHSLRLRSLDVLHDNFHLVTDNLPSSLERVLLSSSLLSGYPDQKEDILSVLLCLTFLRANPYLRELCAHSDHRGSAILPPSNENRIVHSNLENLSLWTGMGNKLPSTIIDAVTIPSLKTLIYACNTGSETLLDFLQRSTPPLTRLEMGCKDASEETLIGILRLLPTLEDLRLKDTMLSDRFFRQLTVTGGMDEYNSFTGKRVICPGLSYMNLSLLPSHNNPNELLESLVTMAKSRASILGTLEKVDFVSRDDVEHSIDVADIDQYVDLIDLHLLYPLILYSSRVEEEEEVSSQFYCGCWRNAILQICWPEFGSDFVRIIGMWRTLGYRWLDSFFVCPPHAA